MTAFSFHPVKTITTGEGGIVTTEDRALYETLVRFRSHGITRDASQWALPDPGGWYYEQIELGYNYRMTDLQSALGLSQLARLDALSIRRQQIVRRYREALADLDGIVLQQDAACSETVNHLFVIRLELTKLKTDRRGIYDALLAEGIGVHVHYIPVYLHPYYRRLGYEKGLCPNAEALYESMLTLPLFPAMLDRDVQDVIDGVHKIIGYYRR